MFFVKTKDSTNIAVYDLAPYNKKTILFVHGWPLDHRIFEYQMNVLPSQGFRCISVDLRGFGNSSKPYDGYNYDTLAADLRTVIDSLNVDTLTLVGFSMGGAVVSRYMSKYRGHKVSKLALVSAAVPSFTSYPGFPYGTPKEEVNKIIKGLLNDRPKTVIDFGKNFFYKNVSEPFRNYFNLIATSGEGYPVIKTAVSLRDENLVNDLRSIRIPTAIFAGQQDKICPYDLAIEANKLISHSKLYSYENAGHAVYYDQLDRFNKDLVDFINS